MAAVGEHLAVLCDEYMRQKVRSATLALTLAPHGADPAGIDMYMRWDVSQQCLLPGMRREALFQQAIVSRWHPATKPCARKARLGLLL